MVMIDGYEQELRTAFEAGSLKSVATKVEVARLKAAARATALRNRSVKTRPYHDRSTMKASVHNLRLERRSLENKAPTGASTKSTVPGATMPPVRFLQTILSVLPVLTASLYLLGLSWHQGYLAAFGIDDSLFPLANDKALLTGFLSLVTLTMSSAVYAFASLGALVILMMLVAVLSSTARVRSAAASVRSWLSRHRPKQAVSPVADGFLEKSAVLYTYAAGLPIALLLLLFMAASSAKSGHEQAEREMADFQASKGTSAQLFSPQVQSPLTGKLVICGDKHCALWSMAGTTILKHEAIDRIVTRSLSIKGVAASKLASAAQDAGTR